MLKKNKFIESWKKFAKKWQKITSPGRPTVAEIKIYENFARPFLKKKGVKILILGATPEIRDMLARYKNTQVTLVDINLDMILAMTSLMKHKSAAEKEIWIRSNWLNAPLPKNYFDLVLGDMVLSNVPFKLQDKFLNNIKSWLRPGGCFINRCESFTSRWKSFSIEEICQIFKNKPINPKTINLFWETGVWLMGDFSQDRGIYPKVFYQRIKKYLKTHPEPKIAKILKKGGILYPLDGIWYTHEEKSLRKLFSKYFIIKDSKFDPKINFIYPEVAPIYLLKPKK